MFKTLVEPRGAAETFHCKVRNILKLRKQIRVTLFSVCLTLSEPQFFNIRKSAKSGGKG